MKSSFGTQLQITLFGESHGDMIGAVINGLAPGIKLDMDYIREQMDKRRPQGSYSTARVEHDALQIVSGYFNGYTTGTPLCILIPNENRRSSDYDHLKDVLRPSHADYAAYEKYLGYQDYRGSGHFSGRITAPLVAAGAICQQILQQKGIELGSHIIQLHEIKAPSFSSDPETLKQQIRMANELHFPCLDESISHDMKERILQAKENKDSVGGILETAISGMPAGIGEPFFDSVESELSHLLFSVPAVKGVEFGLGFSFADRFGSQANDAFYYDGSIKTATNHNGGVNGGITNGMPIRIRTVIKPTSSIAQPQNTVNYQTKDNVILNVEGRHDPAIIHRARVVIDSVIAIGLLDLIIQRYGYLWMRDDV